MSWSGSAASGKSILIFPLVDCAEALKQEIIRRYFRYSCEYAMGLVNKETVQRAEMIMKDINAKPTDRVIVEHANRSALDAKNHNKGYDGIYSRAAIELKDGSIVTGNPEFASKHLFNA